MAFLLNPATLTAMIRQFIARIVSSRVFFILFSLGLLILIYSSLRATWFGSDIKDNHYQELVDLWHGFGTLVVGFGVLLEEYPALMRIFSRQKPDSEVSHLYHDYGVIFVVLGVLIEMCVWMIKINNVILDLPVVEYSLMILTVIIAITTGLFLLSLSYQILGFRLPRMLLPK